MVVCIFDIVHVYNCILSPLKLKGSDFTMSLDGHDKICGYQKSMFPLCIYGGQDTYSGRMNFLRIWTTNNNPQIIGRFNFDYLYESRGKALPFYQLMDIYSMGMNC